MGQEDGLRDGRFEDPQPGSWDERGAQDAVDRSGIPASRGDHACAICRYHARLVVTHRPFKQPSWLTPLYANTSYALFRVKAATCRGSA